MISILFTHILKVKKKAYLYEEYHLSLGGGIIIRGIPV